MGTISVAVPKQSSMELGGQNWVPQKHKLRPKIGANFWAPLLAPFAYRVMLFQKTLINPACQAETVLFIDVSHQDRTLDRQDQERLFTGLGDRLESLSDGLRGEDEARSDYYLTLAGRFRGVALSPQT